MLEHYGRLLGDRLVGGPGRDDGDRRAPGLALGPGLEHPGDSVILQAFELAEKRFGALGREPGHQNLALPGEAPLDEVSELVVSLARGKNHLGGAGASLTIGVEAGKTQVLDAIRLQPVQDISDLRPTRGELFQQSSDFGSVHFLSAAE
jgi:hypothetical protein